MERQKVALHGWDDLTTSVASVFSDWPHDIISEVLLFCFDDRRVMYLGARTPLQPIRAYIHSKICGNVPMNVVGERFQIQLCAE